MAQTESKTDYKHKLNQIADCFGDLYYAILIKNGYDAFNDIRFADPDHLMSLNIKQGHALKICAYFQQHQQQQQGLRLYFV